MQNLQKANKHQEKFKSKLKGMISASVNGRLGKQNKPWNEKNLGNNDL